MDEDRPQAATLPERRYRNNQYQTVSIDKVENGYFVRVGCKNFVFSCLNELIEAETLYFQSPEEAEKVYLNKG